MGEGGAFNAPRRSQKQKEPGQNSFNVETCQRWDYINMTASLNDSLGERPRTLRRGKLSRVDGPLHDQGLLVKESSVG